MHKGVHSAEVIYWARLLYPTLTIVDNRHMQPRPKSLEVFEAQASSGGTRGCIEAWIAASLMMSSIEDATEASEVDKLVTDTLGDHDRSVLLTFGIGISVRMRRGGRNSKSRYYKVRFPDSIAPARLVGPRQASASV